MPLLLPLSLFVLCMWLVVLTLACVPGDVNTRVTRLLEHISSLYGGARSKQWYAPFSEAEFSRACSATLGRILVEADV